MRQVIITHCLICKGNPLGCYDSEREPRKMYCNCCQEKRCPTPTQDFSTGFCDEHFNGQLQRMILKQPENERVKRIKELMK